MSFLGCNNALEGRASSYLYSECAYLHQHRLWFLSFNVNKKISAHCFPLIINQFSPAANMPSNATGTATNVSVLKLANCGDFAYQPASVSPFSQLQILVVPTFSLDLFSSLRAAKYQFFVRRRRSCNCSWRSMSLMWGTCHYLCMWPRRVTLQLSSLEIGSNTRLWLESKLPNNNCTARILREENLSRIYFVELSMLPINSTSLKFLLSFQGLAWFRKISAGLFC